MRQEDSASFAEKTGLPLDQIQPHDLLTGPPQTKLLQEFDAVMVGGSGDYYVSKRSLPHFEAQLDFLAEVAQRGFPMFASCFGFQILVEALGGKIVHDPQNVEVGTYEISLTAAGVADPLMGRMPETFAAQLGRKDRAEVLPEGLVHLASSTRSRYQSFRIPEQPIWATQFHPELDVVTNRARFERYLKGYAMHMTEEEREATRERFQDSPHTAKLLPAFLELVFG